MEGQDRSIMRKSHNLDVDLREDCEEDLADVGHNADLNVVNQESTDLIREARSAYYGGRSVCALLNL